MLISIRRDGSAEVYVTLRQTRLSARKSTSSQQCRQMGKYGLHSLHAILTVSPHALHDAFGKGTHQRECRLEELNCVRIGRGKYEFEVALYYFFYRRHITSLMRFVLAISIYG